MLSPNVCSTLGIVAMSHVHGEAVLRFWGAETSR